MSALTLAKLTKLVQTYAEDTVIECLDSEIDGGDGDEQAHKGGDDSYYFHPVCHDECWAALGADHLPSYMESLATYKVSFTPLPPHLLVGLLETE